MREIPDDLVKMAARGDRTAFEEIYKLTSGYVFAVALRVCIFPETAEEVTQDVFVKLHRDLWQFNFKSELKTWMYRITVNTAIDYYNREKKRRTREVADDSLIENHGVGSELEKKIDKEANEKAVKELLAALNSDQRSCVVLREIEGLSYEEIAKVLKVKINTVRTRLKRAREILVRTAQQKKEAKDEL
ncbi:MAG: sigma-70 family RNA polymerase sigma factor [Candidatus Omnitrophica bacterium]|nr:sigma-70 family RNA polymerase sigma factor [Candidatus Omnitrophota bacterium]